MHIINLSRTAPKFEELADDYNIKDYGVEELTADDVRKHFLDILEKHLRKNNRRNWCENELKIFVWLVFQYAEAIGNAPKHFT